MDFGTGVRGDKADDPLDLGGLHADLGIGSAFAEPVQPERAVGIDHDLDDAGIGQSLGDRRPHRGAQHGTTAVCGNTGGHWPDSVPPIVRRPAAICRPTWATKASNLLAARARPAWSFSASGAWIASS